MLARIRQYLLLMRFDRPIGIFLLLWPTCWGLWLANKGTPPLKLLLVFLTGVVVTRAMGCVINDIADRKIDRHVARTQSRPLTAGKITLKEAVCLFCLLTLLALTLVMQLNRQTILLSFVAIGLAVLYPFLKRVTHWPQLVLGLAFSWSIPMGFSASLGFIPLHAWLLFAIASLWTVFYDTLYAMADRDDDLKIGVKSTAILFGRADKLIVGLLQFIFITSFALYAHAIGLAPIFYLGLLAASLLFIYQQVLISDRAPANCFKAFLNNHWVGAVIFVAITFALT